jgi:parvulin-like peptidyl-prolyl isomerase
MNLKASLFTAAFALFQIPAHAEVLTKNAEAQVTKAELMAEVERSVPQDRRAAWLTSPRNVALMLEQVLTYKTLAARAEKLGLDQKTETAAEISTARARALAKAFTEDMDAKAKPPSFDKRAEELFKLNPQKYTNPDLYDTSQILIGANCEGGVTRAMERANKARERLIKGEDFARVALDMSDDPAVKTNQGSMGVARPDQFVGEYAETIRALKVGEISQPFSSPHGVHVVRLNAIKKGERPPLEKAKPIIISELKDQFLTQRRNEVIAAIKNDPAIKFEEGFIKRLQDDLAKKYP